MLNKTLTILAALATTAAIGCIDERDYVDPALQLDTGWGNGAAAIRGDVGEVRGIDNLGRDLGFQSDSRWVSFSGNVPHQSSSSSVYIQVDIQNANRLPIGAELRQSGTGDVYAESEDGAPVLSVYICPNGEGVSGNADEIVVRRVGQESFTFVATSSVPEQNLDIDLGVGSEREAAVVEQAMQAPASGVTTTN